MKKEDIFGSLIIGLLCGLILPKTAFFIEFFPEQLLKYFPIFLPFLSLFGVFVLETFFKKVPTLIQFGKSFLVGILNSAIDMGVFDFLVWFFAIASGWLPVLFKTISFMCGAINSYLWNKFWTFQKKDTQNKSEEAIKFFLITFGGFLIHTAVINIMINIIGPKFGITERLWANIGNIIAILTGFLWNFSGYKFIVFKK